ncbi:MAG: hypothetical protein GW905_12355 [Rhodobacterales bacterium]|nr:hypothetical protein [Rhodobacterales bacterium]
MTRDGSKNSAPLSLRLGHARRLDPDTREITLLLLGHLVVFALAMGHDEIVAEMVEKGWVLARYAEQGELLIGLALFLCWGALTVRLMRVIDRLRSTK